MEVQQYLQQLESAPPGPLTLLCPAKGGRTPSYEPFLAERAVEMIVSRYVEPSMKDLCYAAFFADEADPREIVSICETLPFLTERRVVVVRRAERYLSATASKPLLAYLESPCETTALVFVASTMDRRSKLFKACDKAEGVVECPELRYADAVQWAQEAVRTQGKTIRSDAARAMVDRTGTHLSDVNNAVQVVCSYVGDADVITGEDVVAACADVAEEQIWALTDAISASRPGQAVRALRELMDLGTNEFQLMANINWLLKNAHAIANNTPALQRVNPYVQKKTKPLADKLGAKKLIDAFALCMDTEILLRSTGVDRALAMELLVIKLAAPGPRKRASR